MPLEDDLKRIVDAALAELTVSARQQADQARQEGLTQGRTLGWEEGHKKGHEEGRKHGHDEGYAQGREEGRRQGRDEGHKLGREEGHTQGTKEGREKGREEGRQQGLAEGRQQGLAEGRQEAEQETRKAVDAAVAAVRADRSADLAASEQLLEGIRAIDRGRALSEILDTLAGCAGREAARAGVFLVRGDRVRSWRLIGFADRDRAPAIELGLTDAGVIGEAVKTRTVASGETGAHAGPPPFAALQAGRESLAIPLAMAGEVVAVVYADQGNVDTASAAGSTALNSSEPPAWPERIEILTRHAARCLEALTALKAARALTERPDVNGQTTVESDRADADLDDARASARRYAKLLVSEIKLYHEAAIVAGRRERDLATRLGGEIARARALYEQRVPPTIRERGDYFSAELVQTLANGDASLLQLT